MESTKKPKTDEPLPNNAVMDLLAEQRGGRLCHEASEALIALTEQVMLTGKPGTLILKIKVSPASKQDMAVVVEDSIDAKLPKVEEGGSFFWVDQGRLTRNNPTQRDLPFVVTGTAEVPAAPKAAINE